VVVLGGHIDSWDVGQGAHDDGSGMIASLQAVALMKKLGLQPRRTIRVAFWVNEENGGRGAQAYRDWLGGDVRNHVAAIEMDGGAETRAGSVMAARARRQVHRRSRNRCYCCNRSASYSIASVRAT
jgi:Zn-dependent M28 family amino/carboxypeptidase